MVCMRGPSASGAPDAYDRGMGSRGTYEKGRARREQILEAVLEVIAERGYGGATLQELASAAGVNRTALLHYFGSKEELFTAVLRRRDEQREAEQLRETDVAVLSEEIVRAVRADAAMPGLTELALRLSVDATEPGHHAREYLGERFARMTALTSRAFARGQEDGTVTTAVSAEDAAVLLWAVRRGLQGLWLHDPAIDMPRLVGQFLTLLEQAPASPGPGPADASSLGEGFVGEAV